MKVDDIDIVKTLVAESETSNIEFKETTGRLERAMETICAFLNGIGGTVLFGITDNGKIIGQIVADKTKRDIAEAINRIEPMPMLQVAYIPLDNSDKQVIAIHAEDARMERPFMYKGRAYHRVECVTTAMPQNVYNHLLLFRDGSKYPWAELESPYLTLDNIDENEVLKTVRMGIQCGRLPENTGTDIPDILQKFGLYTNGKLNNAAAVLFSKGEISGYPQCMVRLARFKGVDKQMFIDNQQVSGNIFALLEASMSFIFKHLSLSGVIEGLEREEYLSIPYKAIRECVINALCHRDYRDKGASVGIAIYDDRVEIENKGTFPHDLDINELLDRNISDPFNPLIAKVLYRRNLLENWGRGISLMITECEKAGIPSPVFELRQGFIVVTFRYNTYKIIKENSSSTPQAPLKYPSSTPQVLSVLKAVCDNPYSVKEIMEILNLSDRKHFISKYLSIAIKQGLVEALYPNIPKHPKQKYRLTEKGRGLLTNNAE